jgi:preprotein translocase subunit SecE
VVQATGLCNWHNVIGTLLGGGQATVAKDGEIKAQESGSGFNPVTFFHETKEELDKVVWPTRQQLISESIAVILMVSLSASLIYLIDHFFMWAAHGIFG